MADRFVDVENRKGSGMPTGILEAGSTGARTLPMESNKVLPEMLIPSWFLAEAVSCMLQKLVDTNLTFCQLHLLGHLCSTPVAERHGWPQWLQRWPQWPQIL